MARPASLPETRRPNKHFHFEIALISLYAFCTRITSKNAPQKNLRGVFTRTFLHLTPAAFFAFWSDMVVFTFYHYAKMRTMPWPRAHCLLLVLLSSLLLAGCGMFQPSVDHGPPPAAAQGALKTAYAQIGKRYRSGGASPQKGFDCSGLIWWAYRQNGVKVPRVTSDQASAGVGVPQRQARAGDIMVFRTGSGPRGLHTGLYAGHGAFVHSPRQGESVRVDSATTPYWRNKLIRVRRVVY